MHISTFKMGVVPNEKAADPEHLLRMSLVLTLYK